MTFASIRHNPRLRAIDRAAMRAVYDFVNDDCFTLAGSLAYYTVFSMPPLLIIVISIAGAIFGEEAAQGHIKREIHFLIGSSGAASVQEMIRNATLPGAGSWIATLLGVGALLFGATGAFVQLQYSLNKAWHVQPDPKQGGVYHFLMKRLLSFGLLLGVAFLLLVSLVLSALISAFGDFLALYITGAYAGNILQLINNVVTLGIITVVFAAMFKYLPDAKVKWSDVWTGAGVTAILFVVGKYLIGVYLGNANIGTAYGAAGSLAIVLVWIYYTSSILLFGAEFTARWADRRGGAKPEEGAVHVEQKEVIVRSKADGTRVQDIQDRAET